MRLCRCCLHLHAGALLRSQFCRFAGTVVGRLWGQSCICPKRCCSVHKWQAHLSTGRAKHTLDLLTHSGHGSRLQLPELACVRAGVCILRMRGHVPASTASSAGSVDVAQTLRLAAAEAGSSFQHFRVEQCLPHTQAACPTQRCALVTQPCMPAASTETQTDGKAEQNLTRCTRPDAAGWAGTQPRPGRLAGSGSTARCCPAARRRPACCAGLPRRRPASPALHVKPVRTRASRVVCFTQSLLAPDRHTKQSRHLHSEGRN